MLRWERGWYGRGRRCGRWCCSWDLNSAYNREGVAWKTLTGPVCQAKAPISKNFKLRFATTQHEARLSERDLAKIAALVCVF